MPTLSSQPKLFRFEGDPATAAAPYVPILLIKQGEREALERIDVETRAGITPWLRVVPPELASKESREAPPAEIRRIARATADHSVYLDVVGTPRRRRSAPRLGPAYVASIYEAALEVDLPFMPVYPFGRTDLSSTIAKFEAPAFGAAVLVRANATTMSGIGSLREDLRAQVISLAIQPGRLDVMIDFGFIQAGTSDARTALRLVREVADAAPWRSVIVSGSSVPDSFASEVPDDALGWIERRERSLFDALQMGTERTLRFSDGAVQHEVPPRPGFAAKMRANVRYTLGDHLYISRGQLPLRDISNDDWPAEYRTVARRMIDEAPFAGPDCCWGDRFVLSLADGTRSARSQHLIRAAATCHHLKVVASEQAFPTRRVPTRSVAPRDATVGVVRP